MAEQAIASRQLGLLALIDMTPKNEDFVCQTCHKIDFQDLLQNSRQVQDLSEIGESSPHTMRYSHGYKLCRLMFQGVPTYHIEKILELRSYSFGNMSNWVEETNIPRSTVLLKIGLVEPYGFLSYPSVDVFCKPASDNSVGLYCAQPVQRFWDCPKARLWLNTCLKCHGSGCKQDPLAVPYMNLINCENMLIIRAEEGMRWLALSYVWGANVQTEYCAGYREGSKIPSSTPATISDAISVTLQLGYRYLWVDEYYIDQKDDEHRNDQIKRMDRIYRGADLTIVAASGANKKHGLPGVGSTNPRINTAVFVENMVVFSNGPVPDNEVKKLKWLTRAWTFQEDSLSKRLLVFTDHQMSFYCLAHTWIEGLGLGFGYAEADSDKQTDTDRYRANLFGSVERITSPIWNWNHLAHILEMYSARQVTKETDTLDALLGVVKHIQRSPPSTQLLRGLPFCRFPEKTSRVTFIDFFEELVTASISWHLNFEDEAHFPKQPQRKFTFPSLTWAGWSGEAEFWIRSIHESRHRPFLRNAQLESSSGQVVVSSALYKDQIQEQLDTVTLIQFEEPVIPAASFSILEGQIFVPYSDCRSYSELLKLKVAGRLIGLSRNRYPHIDTADQFIENLRKGIWSCLMLCAGRCSKRQDEEEDEDEQYSRYVLVVRWDADQVTAERIDSFNIHLCLDDDAGFWLLGEESWTWRNVRLI